MLYSCMAIKRLTVEIDEELKQRFKVAVTKDCSDLKKMIVILIEKYLSQQ